jgi:hypothetical protein
MKRLQEKPTVQRRYAGGVELGFVGVLMRHATTAHADGPEAGHDILGKDKNTPNRLRKNSLDMKEFYFLARLE